MLTLKQPLSLAALVAVATVTPLTMLKVAVNRVVVVFLLHLTLLRAVVAVRVEKEKGAMVAHLLAKEVMVP